MSSKRKSAQEIQDEIFRSMPAERSFNLACDISAFILGLNKLCNDDREKFVALSKYFSDQLAKADQNFDDIHR